jgi:hypothetical protein
MEKQKRQSKTLRLSEEDIEAVLRIRQAYKIATDNQAIIFAIHQVGKQIRKEIGGPNAQAPK